MSDGLRFDASEITEWGLAVSTVPGKLRPELLRTTNALTAEGAGIAGDLAPRKDGILAGSIVPEAAVFAGEVVQGSYGTGVIYAAQKEYGGTISARNAPYLVFQLADGTWRRAKSVYQAPQPYMAPSADRMRTRVKPAYNAAVKRALRASGVGS